MGALEGIFWEQFKIGPTVSQPFLSHFLTFLQQLLHVALCNKKHWALTLMTKLAMPLPPTKCNMFYLCGQTIETYTILRTGER